MQLSWITELQDTLKTSYHDGQRVQPRHTETQHFYEDTVDGAVYPSVTTMTSLLGKAVYKQIAANAAVDYIIANKESDDDVFANARKAHEVNLSQAGSWGTEAHDCVERYMEDWIATGEQPLNINSFFPEGMSNEAKSAAIAAEKFMCDYTLFPIATEMKVVSKKVGFAGTLDSLWAVGSKQVHDGCRHVWAEKSDKRVKCMKCEKVDKLQLLLGDWKSSNRVIGNTEYALQVSAYKHALQETTGIQTKVHWIIRLDKQKPQYEVYNVTDTTKAWQAFKSLRDVYNYYKESGEPIVPLEQKQVIVL